MPAEPTPAGARPALSPARLALLRSADAGRQPARAHRSPPAGRGRAPLVCAGAAVVPGPAAARAHGVQPGQRAALLRRHGRGGAAPGAGRGRAPARGRCAPPFARCTACRAGGAPRGRLSAPRGGPVRRWTPPRAERGGGAGWAGTRRRGRSTWRRGRCFARGCCGWRADEHVLLLCVAPHRQRRVEHGRALSRPAGAVRRLSRTGSRRRCGSCRCSTPTSPRWQREQLQGAGLEPAARLLARAAGRGCRSCWSCRRTIRAPPCRRTDGAREHLVAGRRPAWSGWRRWRAARAPRCSWCCWPPSRCCCAPVRGHGRRGGGQPHRRARAHGDRGPDRARSPTRSCCGPTCPATRRSARWCGASARSRWAPTSTRPSRSRSWWRSSSRSAA